MLKTLIKKVKKSKGGFTLIELIVVIAILAILAVVLIPMISGYISKAKSSNGNEDAKTIYTAANTVAADYSSKNEAFVGVSTGYTTTLTGYTNGDGTDAVVKPAAGENADSVKYTSGASTATLVLGGDETFGNMYNANGTNPLTTAGTWKDNIKEVVLNVSSNGAISKVTVYASDNKYYTYPQDAS